MMNFIKKTAFIFGFIALFASCTEDEGENDSCYTCETTQTAYCYTVGNTYYVTTDADGATHHTELNGASWSDTQDILENQCNGTTEDCYTCIVTNTEYCYTDGDDFYTISSVGEEGSNILLDGNTWADLRAGFEANCEDSSTGDFDILGTWNLTDFHGTSTSVTTYTGSTMTITIDSETTLVTTDATTTYINDGTYDATGSIEIRVVATSEGQVISDTTQTSTPQDSGTWVIEGDQITFNANTSQEAVGTIISQTSNSFTFKSVIYRSEDSAVGNTTINGEFFQTYTKQ